MCERAARSKPTTASPASGPEAGAALPVRVTPFYRRQIERSGYREQLRLTVEATAAELDVAGQWNTSGEEANSAVTGLQHKYAPTVMVLTTAECFGHCRYCFRRRFVGRRAPGTATDYAAIAAYVRRHPEITNVLLSGGDPLTLGSDRLGEIVEQLLPIRHLTSIRFGTRAIVYAPTRLRDPKLLAVFERVRSAGKACIIVTHINHVGEMSRQAEAVVTALAGRGVQWFNQAVLLNRVNDDAEILAATFESIHALGIRPYYLFQARPARGARHFQVPLDRGIRIVHAVNRQLSGIQKTFRFVMSHRTGKLELLDLGDDGRLYMRYHQSHDPAMLGRVFSRAFRPGACWLDDLPHE